ncbi:hypothetical protein DPX16_19962 [Anabarilius grahami]|uniref:Uncharacterized protein n=1 Tax=Anabarilius grahami TaxID=495550 RepID=A0A3N0XPA2_ANAGA|nr:hypothetical protein DPX16_19962 [Anabarilius grahami]
MKTPVHRRKCQQRAHKQQNCTLEQWKKLTWSDESRFLNIVWTAVYMCAVYLGKRWYQDALDVKPVEGVVHVTIQTNILNVIFRVVAHSESATAMIDESQQQ